MAKLSFHPIPTDSAMIDADPVEKLRHASRLLPNSPGVYAFHNRHGCMIYVGKSVNIRMRVASYTGNSAMESPKICRMVANFSYLSCMETDSEIEALLAECRMIRMVQPAYNRQLLDAESICYILWDDWDIPSISIARSVHPGEKYLGPFWRSWTLSNFFDAVVDIFRLRRCAGRVRASGRGCAYRDMHMCLSPCSGEVSPEEYRKRAMTAWRVLSGDDAELLSFLKDLRRRLSEELLFEGARRVHGQISSLLRMSASRMDTMGLSGDFAAVVPSRIKQRPLVLVFSGGRLTKKLLAGSRSYPNEKTLEKFLNNASSARDILPGKPSTDDALILGSYMLRRKLSGHIHHFGDENHAHALHCSIEALREI